MYTLKTEHSFDAAHFLYGYEGKCSNIHGHRWRVVAEVSSDELETTGQNRGMYVDFGDLKKDLKENWTSTKYLRSTKLRTFTSLV